MAVPLPDRATLEAARRRADEERAFWDAHRADLTGRYPDEFVAVRNGKVVDHDADLLVLAPRLQAAGIAPNDVSIEFMATEPGDFHLRIHEDSGLIELEPIVPNVVQVPDSP